MKLIETVPVYNRRSKRVTSIPLHDFKNIKEHDEEFFTIQGDFVIVRDRFFRGTHLVKKCTFHIQGDHFLETTPKENYKKVLVLLEAPHRDEFNYHDDFTGRIPLAGAMGNFRTTFYKLMEILSEEQNVCYEVTLYNLVPFQTSLHYLLKKGTKAVTRLNFWSYGWYDLKYRNAFLDLIKKEPFDYYINATSKTYKHIVSNELSRLVPLEYQVHHPASGFWKRKTLNLGIKKIVHLEVKNIFAEVIL